MSRKHEISFMYRQGRRRGGAGRTILYRDTNIKHKYGSVVSILYWIIMKGVTDGDRATRRSAFVFQLNES